MIPRAIAAPAERSAIATARDHVRSMADASVRGFASISVTGGRSCASTLGSPDSTQTIDRIARWRKFVQPNVDARNYQRSLLSQNLQNGLATSSGL